MKLASSPLATCVVRYFIDSIAETFARCHAAVDGTGDGKTLLTIISDYFSVVKELLWQDQPSKSFIVRMVGILALFDVLRNALLVNQVNRADVRGSAKLLLLGAKGIDFSDDFFHASGAGRVRIRNVLAYLTGLPGPFVPQVVDAAERLRRQNRKL